MDYYIGYNHDFDILQGTMSYSSNKVTTSITLTMFMNADQLMDNELI